MITSMNLTQAEARIHELELENAELKQRLNFWEYAPTLAIGMRGERLVANAVDGVMTTFTAGADVSILRNGLLLEVKFSTLNVAVRDKKNATTRWTWPRPLGSNDSKIYDRLILVGQADNRHRASYLDNEPYIFFDVPFADAPGLTVLGGTHRNIQITTNPKTARTEAAKALFGKRMLSYSELSARYGFKSEQDGRLPSASPQG